MRYKSAIYLLIIIIIYTLFILCYRVRINIVYNKIIFLVLLVYITYCDIRYGLFFILFYFILNNNLNIEGLENENDDTSSILIANIVDYYYKNINQKNDIIKIKSYNVSNDKIPLQIFQMWHSSELLPKMKEARDMLIEQNPEFEFKLFNEKECSKFIKNNFDDDVYDAYTRLIPYAYKCDLWRYCVLYIHGGIYLDIGFFPINNFKFIDIINEEHYAQDIIESGSGICNGLIIVKPSNPILLSMINNIVQNVNIQYYGVNALSPCGPLLFKNNFPKSETYKIDLFLDFEDQQHLFIRNSTKRILQRYIEYRKEQSELSNEEHYSIKWKKREIYKVNSKQNIIPLKLFQTWNTRKLPNKMNENVMNLQKQNPEFEYYLYDDNDCKEFIKSNFPSDVLNAFEALIPGAYKADLWRYCILYINGGIYLDIKYKCMNNFKLIDLTYKEHFVLERPSFWDNGSYGIYNALICSKPKNTILLECINSIVDNVNNNYYGKNPLYPTGPGLLGKLYFNKYNYNVNNFDLFYNHYETSYIITNQIIYKKVVILENYLEYREELKKYNNLPSYHTLWLQRLIYSNKENI
jgi:mannosyltransferase OCH1-like enzyme